MMQGTGWIAWELKEAPVLPNTKPVRERPAQERPVQEQQYGPNIDSLPVEHNAPPPANSPIIRHG
jgi:hypothetical protein